MVSELIMLLFVCCLLEACDTWGGGRCCGLAMRCILMASQVAVLRPRVTALFRAQYSRSDQSDYVMIVNKGRAKVPPPGFFLQSCGDNLYLTTCEMVYKLNGYKRKVKVFAAAASYVQTPAIINDCNVDHIMPKSPLSHRTYRCSLESLHKKVLR